MKKKESVSQIVLFCSFCCLFRGMNDGLCVLYDETGRAARGVLDDGYFESTGVCVGLGPLRTSVARAARTGALRARAHVASPPLPLPIGAPNAHIAARGSLCATGALRHIAAATAALALHTPRARTLELAGAWEPAAGRARATLCARSTLLSASLGAACALCSPTDRPLLVAAEAVLRPTAGLAFALRAAGEAVLGAGGEGARGYGLRGVGVDGRVVWTRGAWAGLACVEQHGRAAGATLVRTLAGGRTRVALDTLFALPARGGYGESEGGAGDGGNEGTGALWDLVHGSSGSSGRTDTGETRVALGVEHWADADTLLRARLDTRCVLHAVCSHRVSPACTQAFSFTVNLADLSSTGGHVAAVSLAFEG